MRYIENIKISKFRSIGQNESFESFDLNIFSGSNDSGKSNYLKALNLFFSGETELNIRYNPESDFNKWYRDNNVRGERNIEIEIRIAKGNYGDKDGINKGFIAKKIFRTDGGQESKFYKTDGTEFYPNSKSFNRANGVITEKFRYVYIPAIRDIKFRESVQRLIQEIANSTDKRFKSQDLKDAFEKMESGIDSQLSELTDYVKELMNIEVETNVNFSTLLESLTFETSEKIKIKKRGKSNLETQKVSLKNRGDGIQMQFFSFLLWFISKNDKKHFYIWGYEEPEIAFEFKRQFELAEIFQKTFSKVAQILITTHSPAFAFSESNAITKVFRINYEKEKLPKSARFVSKIIPIEEYYEGLFKELTNASAENKKLLERDIWGINIQKISKMLGESMNEIIGHREISKNHLDELKKVIYEQQSLNSQLESKIDSIEKELNNTYPNKIFVCEDAKAIKLWGNLLFEKMDIDKENFKIISSKGCSTSEVETAILHLKKIRQGYNPKIYRQFDRDGYTDEQILAIKKAKKSKYSNLQYEIEFLPVNEIENFAVICDSYFTTELVKDFDNYSKLAIEFNATITNNIQSAIRIVEETDKKLFNSTQKIMTDKALANILYLFPGKEIKKLKKKFNPEKILIEKNFTELPQELKIFLENIKTYYTV